MTVLKLPKLTLQPHPFAFQRTFRQARLELRHDPQTLRWTVVLVSRTTKEDVVVAWKQTEADAAAWAENYGARS